MKDRIMYKIYNWITRVSGKINSWAWVNSVVLHRNIKSEDWIKGYNKWKRKK